MLPFVTACARCSPLPAGAACTHRVPAPFRPIRVVDAIGTPAPRRHEPISLLLAGQSTQKMTGDLRFART